MSGIMGKKNVLRKIPALVVMAGIFILSALPSSDPLLNVFEVSDKIKHFIAYFVLGIGFSMWISRDSWKLRPFFYGVIVCVLCLFFGITDEFHQTFVAGRSGNDLGDLTADFIGGLFAPFAYYFIGLPILNRAIPLRALEP